MNLVDLTVSRWMRGSPEELFDRWFDPTRVGGPWHGAAKVIMRLAVDGFFYYGVERETWERHTGAALGAVGGLLGHFGRFVAIDRPHRVEHTWMSEITHGIETAVTVTFEARDGGTLVTIFHRGVPDDEKGRLHEGGWTNLLSGLGSAFQADPVDVAVHGG
jgi:uncharacterized protein YndB with AHSA1/START domain